VAQNQQLRKTSPAVRRRREAAPESA